MARNTSRWRKLYAEAIVALDAGNYEVAIKLFGAAIDRDDQGWEPYYGRAWVRLRQADVLPTDFDLVEADLRRALAVAGPYCADAAALLGATLSHRGRQEEALPFLLQASCRASQPDASEDELIAAFSHVLNQLEKSEGEETSLDRCAALEGQVQAARLSAPFANGLLAEIAATRAFCCQRLNRPDDAAAALQQLRQLAPGHPRLPQEMATASKSAAAVTQPGDEPNFDQVGGSEIATSFQARLRTVFETYLGSPDMEGVRAQLRRYGQQPSQSLLLFGPSGCGKTYIIRSFAGEYRKRYARELRIHRIRLDEVYDRYVGESEKALTRIFNAAIETQPSIIFADEVDAIGGSRSKGQDWRTSQTTHLLQEFDRLNTSGAFVIVFACTNRISDVDQALLRRFDQLVPVEMPDQRARESIFRVMLARLTPDLQPQAPAVADFAKASHGLTPGDIEKVLKQSVSRRLAKSREGGDERLQNADILHVMREYQQPIHVRAWMHESIEALRLAGLDEMVDEVERMYGPYVLDDAGLSRVAAGEWITLPEDAFRERQELDLRNSRLLQR